MAITKLVLSPVAQSKSHVDGQIKPETPSSASLPPRRVSFDESRNVHYENMQWTRDESRCHWYSRLDYQHMKESSRSVAKQLARKEARHANHPESYSKVMLHIYDLCCTAKSEDMMLCEEDQAIFYNAISRSNSRFGLEKVFIRGMSYDKRYRRAAIVDVVTKIQAHYKNSASSSHVELMRRSSESLSRASRLHAFFTATALADSLQGK